MSKSQLEFLSQFGLIRFGEENNLCTIDYEHSLDEFFKEEKHLHGKYHFAEIDNKVADDFEHSFEDYFSME
ncbi:MAG: hypothetical protein BAJALOKI3v1_650005 [Promethearchaeota archaeon]|jgi:hypothetical protein|nr:MAG: hypothetical protein BAJALOKI3v1_650005 [Candidatus Lokiarchaeota archaeon]